MTIQKLIIALGITFIVIGILFPYISKITRAADKKKVVRDSKSLL
jgi:hypothetical protein